MTTQTIPLSAVDQADRARVELRDIDRLAESIKTIGLIQPVVLDRAEVGYRLVAGGRRMAALALLGVESLEHGLTCTPGRAGFVFSSDLSEATRLEIELEENIQRMGMTWTEEVLLLDKTHRDLPYIARASERGLGTLDFESLRPVRASV